MSQPLPTRSSPNSRHAGVAGTAILHVILLLAWQHARKMPPLHWPEPESVRWVQVPPPSPQSPSPVKRVDGMGAPDEGVPWHDARRGKPAPTPREQPFSSVAPSASVFATVDIPEVAPSAQAASGMRGDDDFTLAERARQSAGAIDKALRKESTPTIVAPPDSPEIRMANMFREAAALAPNRWWEAPKIVELVNDGGDGARRFRVLTAAGIYCITERSPATSIDMIEKHGRQRITNCGHEHEQPVNPQEWRTARD